MSSNKTTKKNPVSDRELAFREMNRVLRPRGFGLVTLPFRIINEGDFNRFYSGLENLGFEVLSFSGFYKGPENSAFKVYLVGLRKQGEPKKEALAPEVLSWKMDSKPNKKSSSKKKKKQVIDDRPPIKQEFVTQFYPTKTKKSLEQCIKEAL